MIRTNRLVRCMIEVSRCVEVKRDEVMDVANEEGHDRSSKRTGMDVLEEEVREKG